MKAEQDLYRHYLDVLNRRKTLVLLPIAVCLLAGVVLMKRTRPMYRASTLIFLETLKAPAGIPVSSTVPLQESLKTLLPQLQSRSRIQLVIEKAGLHPDHGETLEDLTSRIARNLRTEMTGKDSFQIVFTGSDPRKVRDTTEALANVFIEQNSLEQVRYAERNVAFLEQELVGRAQELQEKERLVSRFKQKYLGALPDQYSANATRLAAYVQQQDILEEKLRAARERLAAAQNEHLQARERKANPDAGGIESQLESEERRLLELRSTLTDRHPDVVASLERTRQLKALVMKQGGNEEEARTADAADAQVQAGVEIARLEVKRLEAQANALSDAIKDLNERLGMTPKLQADLDDLTRGYTALEESYRLYKKKLEDARTWVNLEKANQGERFNILDPAKIPVRPYSPDPFIVLPLSLIAGLSLGVACLLLAEALDRSFRTLDDLTRVSGLTVLGALGRITTRAEIVNAKRLRILWGALAVAVVLIVGWGMFA